MSSPLPEGLEFYSLQPHKQNLLFFSFILWLYLFYSFIVRLVSILESQLNTSVYPSLTG